MYLFSLVLFFNKWYITSWLLKTHVIIWNNHSTYIPNLFFPLKKKHSFLFKQLVPQNQVLMPTNDAFAALGNGVITSMVLPPNLDKLRQVGCSRFAM